MKNKTPLLLIEQAIMLDDIKERIEKGRISYDDIDFLVSNLGDVGELDETLRNAFYIKADQINLDYALNHPQEFSELEINSLKQRLEGKSIKQTIKDGLSKI